MYYIKSSFVYRLLNSNLTNHTNSLAVNFLPMHPSDKCNLIIQNAICIPWAVRTYKRTVTTNHQHTITCIHPRQILFTIHATTKYIMNSDRYHQYTSHTKPSLYNHSYTCTRAFWHLHTFNLHLIYIPFFILFYNIGTTVIILYKCI